MPSCKGSSTAIHSWNSQDQSPHPASDRVTEPPEHPEGRASKQQDYSHLDTLPTELVQQICFYLPPKSLFSVMTLSRRLNEFAARQHAEYYTNLTIHTREEVASIIGLHEGRSIPNHLSSNSAKLPTHSGFKLTKRLTILQLPIITPLWQSETAKSIRNKLTQWCNIMPNLERLNVGSHEGLGQTGIFNYMMSWPVSELSVLSSSHPRMLWKLVKSQVRRQTVSFTITPSSFSFDPRRSGEQLAAAIGQPDKVDLIFLDSLSEKDFSLFQQHERPNRTTMAKFKTFTSYFLANTIARKITLYQASDIIFDSLMDRIDHPLSKKEMCETIIAEAKRLKPDLDESCITFASAMDFWGKVKDRDFAWSSKMEHLETNYQATEVVKDHRAPPWVLAEDWQLWVLPSRFTLAVAWV